MKAIEALNKVWNSLHVLETSLVEIDGEIDEVQESKRTIEKMLMVIDMAEGQISKETEL